MTSSGLDTGDLGRWAWVRIEEGAWPTLIITAFQPFRSRKYGYGTSYNQQWRFWLGKGVTTCPRTLFWENLRDKLIEWRQNGDRILLLIDTNEDMSDGHLQQSFSRTLGMSDVVREVGGVAPTSTYHRGTRQIDGAWATEDLQVTRA